MFKMNFLFFKNNFLSWFLFSKLNIIRIVDYISDTKIYKICTSLICTFLKLKFQNKNLLEHFQKKKVHFNSNCI